MIDSHVHLTLEQYKEDYEEVIKNAISKGVSQVIQVGCDDQSINDSILLKQKYPEFINLAIGWHPVDVKEFSEKSEKKLEEIINSNPVCAIGEIGLDYYWYPEEKQEQIVAFETQIQIALKYDLPIIIHCREAYDDCVEILNKYAPLKGIMHSFAGDVTILNKVLATGLDIGISGPITFKNGQVQRQAVLNCPLDRIHLETDGPYLTPVPFRGKRNRPEYIEYIAEAIALEKSVSKKEVIKACTNNTIKLFKLGDE